MESTVFLGYPIIFVIYCFSFSTSFVFLLMNIVGKKEEKALTMLIVCAFIMIGILTYMQGSTWTDANVLGANGEVLHR